LRKARLFHREITKQEDGFTTSRGWLNNFKHRHGIRHQDDKIKN